MKKTIYFIALITTFLIVSGSLFKIMHWPGAAVMIILGSFSFAFLFIPLIILKKFKEESFSKDQIIYSIGIILGTVLGLGFIFKIMHWPMATILMLSSIILFNFLYVPAYFISRYNRDELRYSTIINSVMMFSFGSILFAMFELHI
ncbi:MAG: GldL-related protein [Parvicellaceae bacterium]